MVGRRSSSGGSPRIGCRGASSVLLSCDKPRIMIPSWLVLVFCPSLSLQVSYDVPSLLASLYLSFYTRCIDIHPLLVLFLLLVAIPWSYKMLHIPCLYALYCSDWFHSYDWCNTFLLLRWCNRAYSINVVLLWAFAPPLI